MSVEQADPDERACLAAAIRRALERASPGSVTLARGSLAAGASDIYSDIDLLWDVRDDAFPAAVADLRLVLDAVAPVASVRSDLSWQNSAKRRCSSSASATRRSSGASTWRCSRAP
jgi:hypothetical protein